MTIAAVRACSMTRTRPRASGYPDHPPRVGFFTDTSVCIGCKACEVACKEWNHVPEDGLDFTGMSYDNTAGLGADTWRHVAFIEQRRRPHRRTAPGRRSGGAPDGLRWLMASDVCKHCTHAACLDVCPTGALFRTEFGTVVVQQDICNGCGYCVPACPYGVIDRRQDDGRAWKCTLCYDRLGVGGARLRQGLPHRVDPVRAARRAAGARRRRGLPSCTRPGVTEARLYGDDPSDGVGGDGAFFLLLDEPEVYGLPPDPVVTTRDLPAMWRHAGCGRGRRWCGPRPPAFAAGAVGEALVSTCRACTRPGPARTGGRAGMRPRLRAGDGAAPGRRGASGRWCPAPSSPPTTACRPQRARSGSRRHRRLPVPGRPGRRLVAAGRRGAADRPARAGPGRQGRRGRRVCLSLAGWSTTSAARPASSTCCGCSSRPRR